MFFHSSLSGVAFRHKREPTRIFTAATSRKFKNATDLSVARTILHESIHAYFVALAITNYEEFKKALPDLFEAYSGIKYGGDETVQHKEIANKWVDKIATALSNFGSKKGYDIPHSYYEDLAWGGLTHYEDNGTINMTPFFKELIPDSRDRKRILNTINIELEGRDYDGNYKPQKVVALVVSVAICIPLLSCSTDYACPVKEENKGGSYDFETFQHEETVISGRFSDKLGNPLQVVPSVNGVTLYDLVKEDGTFSVSVLPGQYTIAGWFIGYKPLCTGKIEVARGDSVFVTLTMEFKELQ